MDRYHLYSLDPMVPHCSSVRNSIGVVGIMGVSLSDDWRPLSNGELFMSVHPSVRKDFRFWHCVFVVSNKGKRTTKMTYILPITRDWIRSCCCSKKIANYSIPPRIDWNPICAKIIPYNNGYCNLYRRTIVKDHHPFLARNYMNLDSSVNTNSAAAVSEQSQNVSRKKGTPVIPSLLSYVKSIGVGKRPKVNRRNGRVIKKLKDKKTNSGINVDVMSRHEEREYFALQNHKTKKSGRVTQKQRYLGNNWWVPPPPFSNSGLKIRLAGKDEGGITRRLPVQLYGSSKVIYEQQDDAVSSPIFIFPKNNKNIPEVALIGRSNVGKSTLLNALLYGNQLFDPNDQPTLNGLSKRSRKREAVMMPKGTKAITSDRPGETTAISFYKVSCAIDVNHQPSEIENEMRGRNTLKTYDMSSSSVEQKIDETRASPSQNLGLMSMFLVDLPGYGFSFTSGDQKQVWRKMMQNYILNRGKTLRRILLLLDARHGFKSEDEAFLEDLQKDLPSRKNLPPLQIVLTKCDLVEQSDIAKRIVEVKECYSNLLKREPSTLPVMLVSAKPGIGYNNMNHNQDKMMGGILQLQRDLASLVPRPR